MTSKTSNWPLGRFGMEAKRERLIKQQALEKLAALKKYYFDSEAIQLFDLMEQAGLKLPL